jgi:hypothetical protein
MAWRSPTAAVAACLTTSTPAKPPPGARVRPPPVRHLQPRALQAAPLPSGALPLLPLRHPRLCHEPGPRAASGRGGGAAPLSAAAPMRRAAPGLAPRGRGPASVGEGGVFATCTNKGAHPQGRADAAAASSPKFPAPFPVHKRDRSPNSPGPFLPRRTRPSSPSTNLPQRARARRSLRMQAGVSRRDWGLGKVPSIATVSWCGPAPAVDTSCRVAELMRSAVPLHSCHADAGLALALPPASWPAAPPEAP